MGPSDAVSRHRQGAALRAWARSHRFGIAVGTLVAVAAGAAALVVAAFPIIGEGSGLLPSPGMTVSDVAVPWLMSPTDAFGASPTPAVSASASASAQVSPSAPAAPAATPSPAPSRPTPRATPTPGPAAGSPPVSYEAEGPSAVRSYGTRLRRVRSASGGYVVTDLGQGETVRFTVTVPSAGRYALTICYISADQRGLSVRVNGHTMWGTVPTTPDWYTVGSVTVPVDLYAGANTIELGNRRDYAPEIDRIVVG